MFTKLHKTIVSHQKQFDSLYRVLDPHGHVSGRRRTTSVNSKDHHLGSLAEDPAEEDQIDVDDTDTEASGNEFFIDVNNNCTNVYLL